MVVRYENFWPMYVLLLIPMAFTLMLMGLISIWMVAAPQKERNYPEYSLHVMYDQPKTGKGGGSSGAYSGTPYGYTKAANQAQAAASMHDSSKASLAGDMHESAYSRGYHSGSQYQDAPGYNNPVFDRSTASASASAYSEKSRII